MQMQFRRPSTAVRKPGGFTLIEVMIVVAIIGVLAAIAVPQYRQYVLRSQMVDATNLLSTYQARMERHFQDNRSYQTVGTFNTPCTNSAATLSARTSGTFVVTCVSPDTASYTWTATGSGPTLNYVFTVNERNVRTTSAPAGWGNCTTRWILSRGAPCN